MILLGSGVAAMRFCSVKTRGILYQMCGVGTARRGRAIYTRSNEVKKDHEAGVQSNSDSGSRSYFTFGSIGRFNADPFAVSVANKLVISNFHPLASSVIQEFNQVG